MALQIGRPVQSSVQLYLSSMSGPLENFELSGRAVRMIPSDSPRGSVR
jgi:hypothetical protein